MKNLPSPPRDSILHFSFLIWLGCLVLGFFAGSPPAAATSEEALLGGCILKEPVAKAPWNLRGVSPILKTKEYGPFTKKLTACGVTFAAESTVPNGFLSRVGRTIEGMFRPGPRTDPEVQRGVLKRLYEHRALLPVPRTEESFERAIEANEAEFDRIRFENSLCDIIMAEVPDGQVMEVIEHLLHAITDVGLHFEFPREWGISRSSELWKAMGRAIDRGYYEIRSYSGLKGEREVYDRVLLQEFAYWFISTAWNLQEPYGPNEDEWKIRNRKELKEKLPEFFGIYEQTVERVLVPPSRTLLSAIGPTRAEERVGRSARGPEDASPSLVDEVRKNLTGYQIAYASPRVGVEGAFDVWLMEVHGGSSRNLTRSLRGVSMYPEWGPRAEWVYFLSNDHGGALELYRVNSAGFPRPRQVTALDREVRSMSVSSDGNWVALAVMSGNVPFGEDLSGFSSDLYRMRLSGESPGRRVRFEDLEPILTAPRERHLWHEQPSFCPSIPSSENPLLAYSRTILYDTEEEKEAVYCIRLDGTGNRRLLEGDSMPRWTAGGATVVTFGGALVDVETGEIQRLRIDERGEDAGSISIDPHGNYVLFEVGDEDRRPGLARAYVVGQGSSANPVAILAEQPAYEPRWSPCPVPRSRTGE